MRHLFESSALMNSDVIVIMGSFYQMREVREFFNYDDLKDPLNLTDKELGISQEIKIKEKLQQKKSSPPQKSD